LLVSIPSAFPIVHIDASIGQLAYDLLKRYANSDGLRTFDSLIAATAIMQGLELVSRNRKHFAMMEGLRLQSPQY
jgi:predicted nucleic acid-binding protein